MLRSARPTLLALSTFLALSSGCALFEELLDGESVATVSFFATHAGTPTADGYPDYGDSQTTRVFMTDMGWQISLAEAYITTAEIRLVQCGAGGTPIEMFWGPCPEDFVGTNDLKSVPLGAVTVDDGDYCGIDVIFAPFVPPPPQDDPHVAPGNPMIVDNTVVIIGVARRGEGNSLEEVPFQVISDKKATARLDISTIDEGGPFHLEDENFTRDLTVIKTYDTFFDGVDFSSASPADLEAAVFAALELDTNPYNGTFDLPD